MIILMEDFMIPSTKRRQEWEVPTEDESKIFAIFLVFVCKH